MDLPTAPLQKAILYFLSKVKCPSKVLFYWNPQQFLFLELLPFHLFFSETHCISKVLAGQWGKDRTLKQSTTYDSHFCYPESKLFQLKKNSFVLLWLNPASSTHADTTSVYMCTTDLSWKFCKRADSGRFDSLQKLFVKLDIIYFPPEKMSAAKWSYCGPYETAVVFN